MEKTIAGDELTKVKQSRSTQRGVVTELMKRVGASQLPDEQPNVERD